MKPLLAGVALVALALLTPGEERARPSAGPAVGVSGSRLTIDGRPRFLLGVSLFDALGETASSDQDLDRLAAWGIRLVRVWAHWQAPLYGPDGRVPDAARARLDRLVDRLAARGMILELVLLRPGQLPGERFAVFSSAAARHVAVRDLTRALRGRRNILFDLYNEHDHPDGPISHREARALRDAVKAADPVRLVTISSTEYHLLDGGGVLTREGRTHLREEAGTGAEAVRVDILAPHLPRTPDWGARTADRVKVLREALQTVGREIPVYLNEEQRARDGSAPAARDYADAALGARAAGAAGWLFHTGAGYALTRQSFLGSLQPDERLALERLAQALER